MHPRDITELRRLSEKNTQRKIVVLVCGARPAARLRAGGRALRILRAVIAAGAASLGLFFVAASAIFFNPVAGFMGSGPHPWVKGPFILDTLLVAYALPGVLLLAGALVHYYQNI